jgi:hypothetical protein
MVTLLYNNTEYDRPPPDQVRVGRGSALAGYWPSDQQELGLGILMETLLEIWESNNYEINRQKIPIKTQTIIKVQGR